MNRPSTDFGKLRLEEERLLTFHNWPSSAHADHGALARAGFFYTGSGDRVRCAFCRGFVQNWKPTNSPEAEHERQHPNCSFVCGLEVGNVPLAKDAVAASVRISKTRRPRQRTQNLMTPLMGAENRQALPYTPSPPPSPSGADNIDPREIEAIVDTPKDRANLEQSVSRDETAILERSLQTAGKKKRKKRPKEKKPSASGEDIRFAGTPAAPEYDEEHAILGKSPKTESSLSHSDGDISVVSANQASSDEDIDCEVQASNPVKKTTFDTSDEHWRCCKICMDVPWEVVLISCGHALCQSCHSILEPSCPFCRKTITGIIETKLALMSEVRPQTPTEVADDQNEV